MPIKKSAKKALRQTKKRTIRNIKRKRTAKDLIKEALKAVEAKQVDKARDLFKKVQQAVDKAVKTGAIKKNTANRKKSRLAKKVKLLLAKPS